MFTAHIRESDGEKQSVGEHSRNVSALSEKYLHSSDLSAVGELTGLFHDAGKLSAKFDDYINGRNNLKRGSIDHSYAGAKYLKMLAENKDKTVQAAVSGITHTILSHHGINDWLDEDGNDEYLRRTSKDEGFSEVLANMTEICTKEKADELLDKAASEWLGAVNKLMCGDKTETAFYAGMLERLIQSALIDADRADTSDFMSGRMTWPEPDPSELWDCMDKRMDEKLASFSCLTDPISVQRRSISDRCADFAGHRVGACRLIVPTGGGKTLSSLRFAIKQCKKIQPEKDTLYCAFHVDT